MVRDAARAYCQEKLLPRVLEAFRHETTDPPSSARWASWACWARPSPSQYGGAGLNYVCYGLVAREVERVDSGYRSMMSVQSSLVMVPINEFGNEAHQAEVPAQAGHRRMDRLLRPDRAQPRLRPRQHGHPRRARSTAATASRAKMWITNSPIADVFVVWAKDDGGQIRGFVLEKGWKGLSAPAITARWACAPASPARS
jgi:glutaryl-CoA dehydrogenase